MAPNIISKVTEREAAIFLRARKLFALRKQTGKPRATIEECLEDVIVQFLKWPWPDVTRKDVD